MNLLKSNPFNKTALAGLVLLTFFASVSDMAYSASQTQQQLANKSEKLMRRVKMAKFALNNLIDIEAAVIRETINREVPFWREIIIQGEDQENYNNLLANIKLVHTLKKQDYQKTHDLFAILEKRIKVLEIVLTQKLDPGLYIADKGPGFTNTVMNSLRYWFGQPPVYNKPDEPANRNSFSAISHYKTELERKGLASSLMAVYMQSLANPDPEQGYQNLKSFAGVINQLGDINRDLILDQEKKLALQEEIFIWSLIPIVGDSMALAEAAKGEDPFGRKLSWAEKGFALMGAFGAVGDAASLGKLLTKVGRQEAKAEALMTIANSWETLGPIFKPIARGNGGYYNRSYDSLYEAMRLFTKIVRKGENVTQDTLVAFAVATKSIKSSDPLNQARLVRQAHKQQGKSLKFVESLTSDERKKLIGTAWADVENKTPAFDINTLMNPKDMTLFQAQQLKKGLGWGDDICCGNASLFQNNPGKITEKVEEWMGIPLYYISPQSKGLGNGSYSAMRLSNAEGLRFLKQGTGSPKPLEIKGKSGPGGIIPFDQAYSKLSQKLDKVKDSIFPWKKGKAQAEISDSQKKMEKLLGVDGTKDHPRITVSDQLEGRTVVAAEDLSDLKNFPNGKTTLVARDDKGRLFDIATNKEIKRNIRLVKTPDGKPKKVKILIDKKTKGPFVADADQHLTGIKGDTGMARLNSTEGFVTNTEKAVRDKIAGIMNEKGLPVTILHGHQGRAYGLNLPKDSKLYVVEGGGKIRFLNNENELKRLAHAHCLSGTCAGVDPSWGWGTMGKYGFQKNITGTSALTVPGKIDRTERALSNSDENNKK
jgi:hypothetical protein